MTDIVRFFERVGYQLRLQDLLDIAIVALVLYFVLSRLWDRHSRALPLGAAAVLIVYVLARRLDMVLTSTLFRVGLAGILVALVIVFQEDIRRVFYRLAKRRGRDAHKSQSAGFDTVVDGLCRLAEEKMGALIVLPGREPITPHVRGGVEVGGRLSIPLLHSIFHPASAGHDGAVVLRGGDVERLGVHLPLSKDLDAVGDRGTRHTAALGLSERCDALVLIVSEEHGTIGIAQDGSLDLDLPPAVVENRLEAFAEQIAPTGPARSSLRWLRKNAGMKALSVFVAALTWMLVSYQTETIERTFTAPIDYSHVPAQQVVEDVSDATASVTLVGSERIFDLLDPTTLVVSVDLSDVDPGRHRIEIGPEDVDRPAALLVRAVAPSEVRVRTRRDEPSDEP